jgi:hypothetical protein
VCVKLARKKENDEWMNIHTFTFETQFPLRGGRTKNKDPSFLPVPTELLQYYSDFSTKKSHFTLTALSLNPHGIHDIT